MFNNSHFVIAMQKLKNRIKMFERLPKINRIYIMMTWINI